MIEFAKIVNCFIPLNQVDVHLKLILQFSYANIIYMYCYNIVAILITSIQDYHYDHPKSHYFTVMISVEVFVISNLYPIVFQTRSIKKSRYVMICRLFYLYH